MFLLLYAIECINDEIILIFLKDSKKLWKELALVL